MCNRTPPMSAPGAHLRITSHLDTLLYKHQTRISEQLSNESKPFNGFNHMIDILQKMKSKNENQMWGTLHFSPSFIVISEKKVLVESNMYKDYHISYM